MRKYLITAALLLAGFGSAVGTPAGTAISNTATLDLNDGVTTTTITSTPVVVNVQQVYNVTVSPDGTAAAPGQTTNAFPGQAATLTYTVTNTGNGTDTINLNALTAGGSASGANIVGLFVETNGTPGFQQGADLAVTSLTNVAADDSRVVYLRYTVPNGTTGGSAAGASHLLNVTATSNGDGTKTDTNNVGQVTVNSVIDMSLSSAAPQNVTAGATATFNHTFTNTGNVALTPADVAATTALTSTDKSGATIPNPFTVTYTVTGPGGTFSGINLETLMDAAIGTSLASGATMTVQTNVTPNPDYKDGDKLSVALETYSPTAASATVNNKALQGDAQGKATDVVTAQRGVGVTSKTLGLCTTSTSCPAKTSTSTSAISAKPGDYVVYYLTAQNTGSGNLFGIRLSDKLPSDFVPTLVGATTTGVTGTLKFSTDGTTWTTDVTTLGTLTGGVSTLYVAVENGGSTTTITTADTFSAGASLNLKIVGYVRKDSTTGSTVTRDDTGL